jgi:hypothetical protein
LTDLQKLGKGDVLSLPTGQGLLIKRHSIYFVLRT